MDGGRRSRRNRRDASQPVSMAPGDSLHQCQQESQAPSQVSPHLLAMKGQLAGGGKLELVAPKTGKWTLEKRPTVYASVSPTTTCLATAQAVCEPASESPSTLPLAPQPPPPPQPHAAAIYGRVSPTASALALGSSSSPPSPTYSCVRQIGIGANNDKLFKEFHGCNSPVLAVPSPARHQFNQTTRKCFQNGQLCCFSLCHNRCRHRHHQHSPYRKQRPASTSGPRLSGKRLNWTLAACGEEKEVGCVCVEPKQRRQSFATMRCPCESPSCNELEAGQCSAERQHQTLGLPTTMGQQQQQQQSPLSSEQLKQSKWPSPLLHQQTDGRPVGSSSISGASGCRENINTSGNTQILRDETSALISINIIQQAIEREGGGNQLNESGADRDQEENFVSSSSPFSSLSSSSSSTEATDMANATYFPSNSSTSYSMLDLTGHSLCPLSTGGSSVGGGKQKTMRRPSAPTLLPSMKVVASFGSIGKVARGKSLSNKCPLDKRRMQQHQHHDHQQQRQVEGNSARILKATKVIGKYVQGKLISCLFALIMLLD